MKSKAKPVRKKGAAVRVQRVVRRYCDSDQARMDALPSAFWKAMKALPAMRKATDAEMRLLSWCEGAGLLYGMKLCGHYAYDKWRRVLANLRACNLGGDINVGHVLAMVATRTPNDKPAT